MRIVINILLDFLQIFKFFILNEMFFSFNKKKLKNKAVIIIFLITMVSVLVTINPRVEISILLYFMLIFSLAFLVYDEKKKNLMITSVWAMFLVSFLDEMAYALLDVFIKTENIKENVTANFASQICTVIFLLITGLGLKKSGKGKFKQVGILYMTLFTVLVIADAFVLMILGDYVIGLEDFRQRVSLRAAYIIVVLGMFFQIMLVLLLIVSRDDSRQKEKITQKYLENQIEHYRYLEWREEETKKFRHDIRSHMFALQSYLQKEQYTKMQEHIKEINGTMEAFEKNISVNNDIVDAILNKSDMECKQQGIKLKVKGHFPVHCNISAYDLCTIFSNLLSNAQEAAVNSEKRQILVSIRYTQNELIIHVENDYTGQLRIEGGEIRSKKKNSKLHGIGLENIKCCVEKNHGYINISTDNQKFIVKIILNLGDQL